MSKTTQAIVPEVSSVVESELDAYQPMHNVLLVMPLREAHELKYRAKYHNQSVCEYIMQVLKLDIPLVLSKSEKQNVKN